MSSVCAWLRQLFSLLLDPVGAVDAPCLVAGLVVGWLTSTVVPGFWLAAIARQALFSVPGRAAATNSGTTMGVFVSLQPR